MASTFDIEAHPWNNLSKKFNRFIEIYGDEKILRLKLFRFISLWMLILWGMLFVKKVWNIISKWPVFEPFYNILFYFITT